MLYKLLYHPKVKTADIPSINPADLGAIQRAIEQRLLAEPLRYGLPLRWGLRGFRKLRVGDYRVVYYVAGDEIRILTIGHRKDVYKKTARRSSGS